MKINEKTVLKRCPKCKKEKTEHEFYSSAGKNDGLDSWCIKCKKEYFRLPRVRYRAKELYYFRLANKVSAANELYDELMMDEEFRDLVINLGK